MKRDCLTKAAAALLLPAQPALADAPSLDRVLSAVTLSFRGDGATDRAVLVANRENGADLFIYLALDESGSGAEPKPALVKRNVAWSGALWGTRPSLAVNGEGSLVIASANDAIGRSRWSETLTIAYRNGAFVVAGLTYAARDTLDPKAGGACEINYLTGVGKRDGKPVKAVFARTPLAEWNNEDLPKACQF